MSNKALFSLAFIIGTVTGSVVTWYLLKDKYEALAQEEIDSVKEVFLRREQELKDQSVKKTVAEGIKDADKEKPPASVTKVMTLLLIFEALSKKQITLNDTVTVSEHAASMGGSQVFLEPGETQSVDTMIKCIAVSSANDACVAYSHSRN